MANAKHSLSVPAPNSTTVKPNAATHSSTHSYLIQSPVYSGLVELRSTLETLLGYLIEIRDSWADGDILEGSYGLQTAAHTVTSECEKLKKHQDISNGYCSSDQLVVWEVIRTVVSHCLKETANPLREKLRQSLHQPQPTTGRQFLNLLRDYEDVIIRLNNHRELLYVLRTALDLAQSILETEKAHEEDVLQNSERSRAAFQDADFATYKAADRIKRCIDQLRERPRDPDVDAVIRAADDLRKAWRSTSRNVFFPPRAPGTNHYIGQKEQLEVIRNAFEQPDTPTSTQKRFVIQGLPGSGKSEMALRYATQHRERFWGVFWIDASSKTNLSQSYIEMAKKFGENSTEQAAKQHLSTRHPMHPWLLVVDNADEENLLLENLVPTGDNGYVLVTTRDPGKIGFGTAGKRYLRLDSMQEDDASELLLTAAEYKKEEQEEKVLKEVANVCRQLYYLPLALVYAGKVIRHHAMKVWDYMPHFHREANIIRERWSQRRMSREGGLIDDNDRMSVFASFELLTFSQLNSKDQRFTDAIQLLQVFSFLDFQNIRVDFFIQAALNPIREATERRKGEKEEEEVLRRLGIKTNVSWGQTMQGRVQAAFSLFSLRPILPEALKNPRHLDVEDLEGQVQTRVRSALQVLVSRSLITRATRDDERESYIMHPLVHQWIRERPSLSVAEQALFCQNALTVLSSVIQLVDDDEGMELRRTLKPHIEKALEFSKVIEDRIKRNRARGENDWWVMRFTRWATQKWSGPWQAQMQVSQNARFGKVFLECGAFKEAEGLLWEVHDYLEHRLGPDHQLTQLAKLGLAKALLLQTRQKACTDLLRQVYTSRRRVLGERHPRTLEVTMELAESVLALRRITESFELCKQALAGLKGAYGEYDKRTIHCADLLGQVYFCYFDFEACLSQHREVMRQVEQSVVPELEMLIYQEHLAGALMHIFRTTVDQRGLEEADYLSEKVVTRREQILGKWHPYTLYGRAQRDRILAVRWQQDSDRLAEIAQRMFETLEVAQRDLGDSHVGVLAGKKWYAEVLILQGRLDEAETYLRQACDKRKYADASDIDGEHPDRIWSVWELAQLLDRAGKSEEALKLCRELEVSIKEVGGHGLGPTHRFNKVLLEKIEVLEDRLGASRMMGPGDWPGIALTATIDSPLLILTPLGKPTEAADAIIR